MKRLIAATILGLLLGATTLAADQHGKGKKHEKEDHATAHRRVVWIAQDIEVVRTYYAPQSRRLPPGLQKKYERTGQLPPGWQKKMQPLPIEVERRCTPLPNGYLRGIIEGRAVIYTPGGSIIDVAVLF